MSMTYELQRVAELLDEFAAESGEQAANPDLPIEERRRWLSEEIAYETAAKRLREVQLATE